jgi:hypothetical protein
MIRMTILPRGSIYDRNPDTPVLPVLACHFPGTGFAIGLIERGERGWVDATLTIDTRKGSVEVSGLPGMMILMKRESGGVDPFVALPVEEDVIGIVQQDGSIGARIERHGDRWSMVEQDRTTDFDTLDQALEKAMIA